jgi:hypothetical protein
MTTYTTTNVPVGVSNTTVVNGNSAYATLVIGLVFSNTSASSATVTLSSVIGGTTAALSTFSIAAGGSYTWPKTLSVATSVTDGYSASVVYGAGITSGVLAAVTSALDQSSATVTLGFTPRGLWSAGTVYAQNDIVNYIVAGVGNTWVARRASTGVTPVEGADWAAMYTNGNTLSVAAGTGLSGATIDSDNISGSLSINPAVVATLTNTQTLTNKTLTAPTLNNPTFSSAIPGYALATSGYGFRFGASNPGGAADVGWYLPTLPVVGSEPSYYVSDTLVGLDATQSVTNKTAIDLNLSGGFKEEFTERTGATGAAYTYIISFADGQMQRILTSSTASSTTTVRLPAANTSTGRSIMIMVKITVSTATVIFSSPGYVVEVLPGAFTSSTVVGAVDIYTLWCDGIKWFGVQTVKGFS